jgi:hypothetical protein
VYRVIATGCDLFYWRRMFDKSQPVAITRYTRAQAKYTFVVSLRDLIGS